MDELLHLAVAAGVMLRRAAGVAAVALLVVLATAGPASAHAGTVQATNYQPRIKGLPTIAGIGVRIVESGWQLELTNRTGDEVVVLGYQNEPYLRVGAGGVFANRFSPAVYLNAPGGVAPPPFANPDASPVWDRLDDGKTVRWHDHRLHWMAGTPPEVVRSPGHRHVVARWEIPLWVGQRDTSFRGDILYEPSPPAWPWLLAAIVLAAAVVGARRFGAREVLVAAVLVVIAADVIRVAGLSLVVSGGAGAVVREAVHIGTLDFVGWGLGLVAVVRLLTRHADGRVAAGAAGLLLAMVGGVLEWRDLGRSNLAVATPPLLARGCVAATVGLGLGLAALVLLDTAWPTRRVTATTT